jgi:hypothetical protein
MVTPDWFDERLDLHYALDVLRDGPASLTRRDDVPAEIRMGTENLGTACNVIDRSDRRGPEGAA